MQDTNDYTAFPIFNQEGDTTKYTEGLSKREYFAAMAMQGILANPSTSDADSSKDIAIDAVMLADQLIQQLNDISPA